MQTNLGQLNLGQIYQKAEASFKACIDRDDNGFLKTEVAVSVDAIMPRREWIKLQFSGTDIDRFVVEVRLDLVSNEHTKIGYYCYHEDSNGLFIDDYLVFE